MKPVIITGNRCSGKSTIMKYIEPYAEDYGIKIVKFDDVVANAYATNTDIQYQLMNSFGVMSKEEVRQLILDADPIRLRSIMQRLDGIFTPLFLNMVIDAINNGERIIIEWAMYFEALQVNRLVAALRGSVTVVSVDVDEPTRRNRVAARDTHLSDFHATKLDSMQLPTQTKNALADIVTSVDLLGIKFKPTGESLANYANAILTLLEKVGGDVFTDGIADAVVEVARRSYNRAGLSYHNYAHAQDILWILRDERLPVRLAALFHDAIYVPGATDNEERSAELMINALRVHQPGMRADYIETARKLILMTKDHRIPDNATEEERDFLIADMYLGLSFMPHETAKKMELKIRDEWLSVGTTRKAFRKGRKEFLQSLLDDPDAYGMDEDMIRCTEERLAVYKGVA